MKPKKCPKCAGMVFYEIQKRTYRITFSAWENNEKRFYNHELVSIDEIDGYICRQCGNNLDVEFFME